MFENGVDRRDFLKAGAMLGAGLLAGGVLPGKASAANFLPVTLDELMIMDHVDMAKASGPVMDAWRYIRDAVTTIDNSNIRDAVLEILENPAPTIMRRLGKAEKQQLYNNLTATGMLKDVAYEDFLPPCADHTQSPQPFFSAPGGGYGSHHAYPGGLAIHTALNIKIALALYESYRDIYGFQLDRDVIIASQALHDMHKTWVFQWMENGACRAEQTLADVGEHHVLGLAESFHRGLPVSVCVAQACAHNHPGFSDTENDPVNWIRVAAKLIGRNAAGEGWISSDGNSLPRPRSMENFICHLGDHDWVLTMPAARWTIPLLKDIAARRYGMSGADLDGKKFNQFRNYVFSQTTIMGLYEVYATQGRDALTRTIASVVTPV